MIPSTGGGGSGTTPRSVIHQLVEQEGRSLPPGMQTADPASGMDTIAFMSDWEFISDDDAGWGYDPVE